MMLVRGGLGRLVAVAVSGIVLATAGGCSSTERTMPERVPVEGTVTLDGRPLREGRIEFKTVETGLIEGLAIASGTYAGRVGIGARRVEFSVLRPTDYQGEPMPGVATPAKVPQETLPPHLNQHSTYSVTVTRDGPNAFQFELSTKPGK